MGLQNIPNALLILTGVVSLAFSTQETERIYVFAFIFTGLFLILGGFCLWDRHDASKGTSEVEDEN